MNFKELALKTRTVHRYDETKKVEEKVIEEALNISLLAPNHKFTFPWKFYWPTSETREKIIELFAKIKGAGNSEKEEASRKTYKAMSEILFFSQKLAKDEFTRKEDYASLSCAVQLFALALAEKGVSYKWSTSSVIKDESLYKLLNIKREEEEIVGMISVGYPEGVIPPRRRPELSDVLVRI